MAKTLDDVVEELGAIRREMVTRSEFAQESASTRSHMEDLKEDLLKALEGIAVQQTAFALC